MLDVRPFNESTKFTDPSPEVGSLCAEVLIIDSNAPRLSTSISQATR